MKTRAYKHLLTVALEGGFEFDLPYQMKADGNVWFADLVESDGRNVTAHFGDSTVSDVIEQKDTLIRITRRWNLNGNYNVQLIFAVLANMKASNWAVPGAVYSRGAAPSSLASSAGPVEETLCTVPCCSTIEDSTTSLSVFSQPAGSADEISSVSTLISTDHIEIAVSIPGDVPVVRGKLERWTTDHQEVSWGVEGQLAYERTFYILVEPAPRSLDQILDTAWGILLFQPETNYDWTTIAGECVSVLIKDFFIERNDSIGFVENIGALGFPAGPRLRGGIRGGNIETARAIYRIGRMTENSYLKRIALDTADFFLTEADREDESIMFDYHPASRKWSSPRKNEELLEATGRMLTGVVRIHTAANPVDHNPRWLFTAKRIADDILEHMKSELFQKTGDESKSDSRSSDPGAPRFLPRNWAYPTTGLLELFRVTGEKAYFDAGEWLCGHLFPVIAKSNIPVSGEASGSSQPLSRNEAHSFLHAFLLMHEITSRAEYVEAAVRCAHYLRSMTYAWRVPVLQKSDMEKMEFNSCGAVSPIPCSRWLDIYPITMALDMLRLWKITGNELWHTMAVLHLSFVSRLFGHGKGAYDPIWGGRHIPEKFFHSVQQDASFRQSAISGQACWVPTIVLGSILDINEQFPEIINLNQKDFDPDISQSGNLRRIIRHLGTYLNFF